jgi:hypothetical protein
MSFSRAGKFYIDWKQQLRGCNTTKHGRGCTRTNPQSSGARQANQFRRKTALQPGNNRENRQIAHRQFTHTARDKNINLAGVENFFSKQRFPK